MSACYFCCLTRNRKSVSTHDELNEFIDHVPCLHVCLNTNDCKSVAIWQTNCILSTFAEFCCCYSVDAVIFVASPMDAAKKYVFMRCAEMMLSKANCTHFQFERDNFRHLMIANRIHIVRCISFYFSTEYTSAPGTHHFGNWQWNWKRSGSGDCVNEVQNDIIFLRFHISLYVYVHGILARQVRCQIN